MIGEQNLSTIPGRRAPWTASVPDPSTIQYQHTFCTTICPHELHRKEENRGPSQKFLSIIGIEISNSKSYFPSMSGLNAVIYFIIFFNFACSYIIDFYLEISTQFGQGTLHPQLPARSLSSSTWKYCQWHFLCPFTPKVDCVKTSLKPCHVTVCVRSYGRLTPTGIFSASTATLSNHPLKPHQPPHLFAYEEAILLHGFFSKRIGGYFSVGTLW